jgi:hypothetical protein
MAILWHRSIGGYQRSTDDRFEIHPHTRRGERQMVPAGYVLLDGGQVIARGRTQAELRDKAERLTPTPRIHDENFGDYA